MPPSPDFSVIAGQARHPRIALFAGGRDVHARAIARHLRAAGGEVQFVSLTACAFDTRKRSGLSVPGFARALPDAALVRHIPAGSFEAVTRRLGLLHALRARGVMVWNDARAIERCVDKSTTSFLLARAGLPTPPTWTVESEAEARALVRRHTLRGPLVLKPLFGSQGRGLRLIESEADLPGLEEVDGVYYLQRYMGAGDGRFHDYRVFVVAGHAIAAMRRNATGWVTNIGRGAEPAPQVLDPTLDRLAVAAAQAVAADFCGVDILPTPHGPMLLEVNSMPAWQGLQKVTHVNIAQEIVRAFFSAAWRHMASRDRAAG